MSSFYHGIEVVELSDGLKPITTQASSVIGLVGSAGKGAVNTPVLITNRREAATTFGSYKADGFTIPEALDGIFDQTGAAVVVINVCDSGTDTNTAADEETTLSKVTNVAALDHGYVSSVVLSDTIKYTAPFNTSETITAPSGATIVSVKSSDGVTTYTISDDYTVASNVITRVTDGEIDALESVLVEYTLAPVLDTDYTLNAEEGEITRLSTGAIPAGATLKVTSYTYVDPAAVTNTDVIGGVDGGTGAYTGVHALLGGPNEVGSKPKILIAPGFTHTKADSDTANPVVAELLGIADKLKAIIIADGPNTTDAKAFEYRNDWDSDRVYMIDPWVKVVDPSGATVSQAPSSRVAGVIARTDNDSNLGYWNSPSNKIINGIVGTSRGVEFTMGDATTRANLLNAQEVTTIVNVGGGYRLWGNRLLTSNTDYQFINVRRTADQIHEAILASMLWAVDRGITTKLISSIVDSVKSYLQYLKSIGAIIDGDAWADSAINTQTVIQNGQLYIDFDFAVSSPAERITFRSEINNTYLASIFTN